MSKNTRYRDRDWLYEHYITMGEPIAEIAKMCGLHRSTIGRWLHKFGMGLRPTPEEWLRNPETGRKLEIDGYNEELRLGFEYQGRQHFEFCGGFFHETEEDFNKQVARDSAKLDTLREHGIMMLYPTHELRIDEYENYIHRELKGRVA